MSTEMWKLDCQPSNDFKRRRRRRQNYMMGRIIVLCAATLVLCRATMGFVSNPFYRTRRPPLVRRLPHGCRSHSTRVYSSKEEDQQEKISDKDVQGNPSYWIAPDQLERLKESVDIVSVVESYGLPQFQRKGNNRAMALCPFHSDRNPSLHIDSTRKLYKCFACGAGGDVFGFVRAYSALGGEEMSFGQAVRHVAKEFGDGTVQINTNSNSGHGKFNETERQEKNAKKQRLWLANAAAADFYAKCLMTLPSAGPGRSHLRSRGLSPATVRTFAMGFAPDTYFQSSTKWGDGSLVNRLRDLGFTPDEIVSAGLAIRTKKKPQWDDVLEKTNHTSAANNDKNDTASRDSDETVEHDYSTLMDRFRGRLMVPIFDAQGKHVLGVGGRILPKFEKANNNTKFKPPKYLNSPESLVFQKSHVLFGQHLAKEAVKQIKEESSSSSSSEILGKRGAGSVVVVEGYMDAIALNQVGVKDVVACMGTAVSLEQLANAARTAGTHGGRIILCLDGDEAGINAVERLCSGTLLSKTCDQYVVEIVVATLPEGIKDPADFIESKGGKDRSGDAFRTEIIGTAKDWTVWYLERIMSRYDSKALRGGPGSFSDVCERVSDFLSSFPNPAERTKRAFEVAGILSDIVAGVTDSSGGSKALTIQLESDLVAMTSRKAAARESVERRIETVDGVSPEGAKSTLEKMSRGEGLDGADDKAKLSFKATKAARISDFEQHSKKQLAATIDEKRTAMFQTGEFQTRKTGSTRQRKNGRRKMRARNPSRPPLTPHFAGFEFQDPHDAAWLGAPKNKRAKKNSFLTLGAKVTQSEAHARYIAARQGVEYIPGLVRDDIVYFNSNEYHGEQFLTQEAMSAGYPDEKVPRDALLLEHGVGTLVKHKPDKMVVDAESRLLTTLLEYKPARNAMKSSLASSDATGSEARIEWSSQDRQWLFEILVDHTEEIPPELFDSGNLKDLREYLASRPDSPACAFGPLMPNGLLGSADEKTAFLFEARVKASTKDQHPEGSEAVVDEPFEAVNGDEQETKMPESLAEDMRVPSAPPNPQDIESLPILNGKSQYGEGDSNEIIKELELDSTSAITVDVKESTYEEQIPEGSLDMFFAPKEDIFADTYDTSITREARAELDVQEALSTLLQASAMKRHAAAKNEWLAATRVLHSRLNASDSIEPISLGSVVPQDGKNGRDCDTDLQSMELGNLEEHCHELARKILECSQAAQELELSARRIRSRMLDYGSADGWEGRLSLAKQEELAAMLDDHVANLPEDTHRPETPGSDRDYVFGSDEYDEQIDPAFGGSRHVNDEGLSEEEAFELDMEQIEADWGQWSEEGYSWSAETQFGNMKYAPSAESGMLNGDFGSHLDEIPGVDIEDDEESLEEALARIDAEWGDLSTSVDVEWPTKKGLSGIESLQVPQEEHLSWLEAEEQNGAPTASRDFFSQSRNVQVSPLTPKDSGRGLDTDVASDLSTSKDANHLERDDMSGSKDPNYSSGAKDHPKVSSTSTKAIEKIPTSLNNCWSQIEDVNDPPAASDDFVGTKDDDEPSMVAKNTASVRDTRCVVDVGTETNDRGEAEVPAEDSSSQPRSARPIPPILECFGGYDDDGVSDGTIDDIGHSDYPPYYYEEESDEPNRSEVNLPSDHAPQLDDFLSNS